MVLTVRAFENRRTDQDDAKEDTSGVTPSLSTVPAPTASSSLSTGARRVSEVKSGASTTSSSEHNGDFSILAFGGMHYGSKSSELVHRITKDRIETLPPLPHVYLLFLQLFFCFSSHQFLCLSLCLGGDSNFH
jgi:hypothetical protein